MFRLVVTLVSLLTVSVNGFSTTTRTTASKTISSKVSNQNQLPTFFNVNRHGHRPLTLLYYYKNNNKIRRNNNKNNNEKIIIQEISNQNKYCLLVSKLSTTTRICHPVLFASSGDVSINKSLSSLSSSSSSKQNVSTVQSLLSAITFVIIDVLFRRLFTILKISFPSSLGACGVLLTLLLALQSTSTTSSSTTRVYDYLQPGAAVLAKWLPLFFVPSLITLPLTADSVGSVSEVLKISIVIVGGFLVSLATTAFSVVAVRKLSTQQPTSLSSIDNTESTTTTTTTTINAVPVPVPAPVETKKPFSDELFNILVLLSGITGVASVSSLYGLLLPSSIKKPLTSLFLLISTVLTFVYGARLPKSVTKFIHPLVTCTTISWCIISAFATITGTTFTKLLVGYRRGSGLRGLYQTGAGDVLLFLLGPAVVSLAISMYERRRLIRTNSKEITTAIAVSNFVGLFGTAYAVRLINILNPFLRLSLLSRNITSPLAMSIASILGADTSLAVSFVVITGLIGANFGSLLLNLFGITSTKDPIARGLSIGSAAHGLGTAAFVNEKDAFPFAAIAMALTATVATITVSIPPIRNILVQIALG